MSTNDFDMEDDFFNHQILLGKTIEEIRVLEEDEKHQYVLISFSDFSCLEFTLNNINDIFYMEEVVND